MDPNEALSRYLKARAAADEAADIFGKLSDYEDAVQAADDLLTWLANGGFQPDWTAVR